jgi:uroporphyrin-III C-methyltransferase
VTEGAASAQPEQPPGAASGLAADPPLLGRDPGPAPADAGPLPPPPRSPAPAERPRASARDGAARSLATLAFVLAAVAAGFAAWSYLYPPKPDLREVQSAVAAAGGALEGARSSMARLDTDIADMRERVDALENAHATLLRDVDTVRNQTLETVDAIKRLAEGDAFTSSRWIRAEAEHLMQSANIALELNHDADTALAALEAADDRLRELADPGLTDVRARLAEEIGALRALPRTDLAGIALTLGSLAARIELLPVLGERPSAATDAAAGQDAGAWDRAVARVGAALRSMVSVQRTAGSGAVALAPEERWFVYRSLELELESARLAALRGDAANYAESLASARRSLETRFVQDDPGVASALAALAELEASDLVTEWPDISGSLAELRRAEER